MHQFVCPNVRAPSSNVEGKVEGRISALQGAKAAPLDCRVPVWQRFKSPLIHPDLPLHARFAR